MLLQFSLMIKPQNLWHRSCFKGLRCFNLSMSQSWTHDWALQMSRVISVTLYWCRYVIMCRIWILTKHQQRSCSPQLLLWFSDARARDAVAQLFGRGSVVKSWSIPLLYRSHAAHLSLAGRSTGNIGFRVPGNYLKCGRKKSICSQKAGKVTRRDGDALKMHKPSSPAEQKLKSCISAFLHFS